MSVLALDIGSTQWKAGIFDENGQMLAVYRIPAPLIRDEAGESVFKPPQTKIAIFSLIQGMPHDLLAAVSWVALTGMAEAGLLIDKVTGESQSDIWPWFDKRSVPLFREKQDDPLFTDRYAVTGLPNSYKYSIYKLLTLLAETSVKPDRLLWLGIVEYTVWLLTGEMVTEPTLAARTYAFDMNKMAWDRDFLAELGLPFTIFPQVLESGSSAGLIKEEVARETGLAKSIPVCICGHDHICAAFGLQASGEGRLFMSMGTAQVVLAHRPERIIGEKEIRSGLSYGPALEKNRGTMLGSIQSSGSSITMINSLLYEGDSFDGLILEASHFQEEPGGILYFPYLAGSGAPHVNAQARGAFIGLQNDTQKHQMLKAVYEGIAFESKLILDAFHLQHAEEIIVCGGLCAHQGLLQILSDVLGLTILVPDVQEGTLLGAARLVYTRAGKAYPKPPVGRAYHPRASVSKLYADIYRQRYLPMQKLLLSYYGAVSQ